MPPSIRAEGYTEPVSDLVLSCNGSAAAVLNVSVQFNTNVTNRLLNPPLADALLLVDDPAAGSQVACSGTTCNGAGQQNVFQGVIAAQTLTFSGVSIPSAGTHTLRITGARVNATTLAVPGVASPQVTAILSASLQGSGTVVPISNNTLTAAFVAPGFQFQMRMPDDSRVFSGTGVTQCGSNTVNCRLSILRFAEGFATAAKARTTATYVDVNTSPSPSLTPQDIPGLAYQSESGFYNPNFPSTGTGGNLSQAGVADAGTRFQVTLNNIPAGVTVYVGTVPVTVSNNVLTANTTSSTPVARLVAQEAGAFSPVAQTTTIEGIPAAALPVTNGAATAVWEVLNANAAGQDNFDFPLWIGYTTAPATPVTIYGSAAPDQHAFAQSNWPILGTAQSSAFAVPRFLDNHNGVNLFAAGDINSDGHPDLLWQDDSTAQVTVNYYGGAGGASFVGWNWMNTTNNAGWHLAAAADFDGNGVPDLVWQNDSTGQVTVNFYGGTAGEQLIGWAWLNTTHNPGWNVVAAADFNGDGVPDLVWQNGSTRQVTVNYYGNVNGQWTITGWNWLNATTNTGWHVAGAADLNGDGVPDLLWQNDSNGTATVNYYGTGAGQPAITGWNWINTGGAAGWTLLGASDLDGNGVPDTIWQNNSTRQVSVNYYSFTNGQPVMTGWAWLQPNNTPGWHAVVPR